MNLVKRVYIGVASVKIMIQNLFHVEARLFVHRVRDRSISNRRNDVKQRACLGG